MIHAIIIDDEINGLKSLEFLLRELDSDVKIVGATTYALQGIDMINDYRPDLVFLDISMPQLDGFEVLERLQFKNFFLVFVTAHHKYALRALKQGATDYLLKPVDRRELKNAIEKIKMQMTQQHIKPDMYQLLLNMRKTNDVKIVLPTKQGIEYVGPNDIVYIEARSNHASVSLSNGQTIDVTSGLKDFELQLCKKELNFIRIQHSYIINVDYVTRYIKDDGGLVVLRGKKTIPVSRQKKDEFLKMINFTG